MAEIISYNSKTKRFAHSMRNKPTAAEKKLWYKIRCRQLSGMQFCRQMRIASFIIDFYCKELKLAIEIDGPIHFTPQAIAEDRNRDYALAELGIRILRFTNDQVFNNIDYVIRTIILATKNRPLEPR